MNSKDRCMAVLNGQPFDRIPVVPQSFMYAVESAGMKIGDVNKNGKKMAEAHMICCEKYGYDGIIIDFDDASLAEACGAKVIMRDHEPAIVDESQPLLTDLRQVEDLEVPDPLSSGRLPEWLEATRILTSKLGDEVFIMGRADQGPFTLACLLRGTERFMMDVLTEDPELIRMVIDYCRRVGTAFAKAQKDAGAHITSIGDALAGPNLVSPDTFRDFALQPEIEMTREVQAYGIPFSIHICGDTTGILPDMGMTKAKMLELDWKVDLAHARRVLADDTIIMGNIDPSDPLVLGTPEKVSMAAKAVIEKTKGQGLILSSGCAIGRNTPDENLRAMIGSAREFGTWDQVNALQNKE